MKRWLFVFSSGPFSTARGQEGLDAVLAAAAMDIPLSMLFIDEGIFQLKNQKQSSAIQMRDYTKTYGALADFGVESFYVEALSLSSRGLELAELMLPCEVLETSAVNDLIAKHDQVFTF